jgi:hypothetical protein
LFRSTNALGLIGIVTSKLSVVALSCGLAASAGLLIGCSISFDLACGAGGVCRLIGTVRTR